MIPKYTSALLTALLFNLSLSAQDTKNAQLPPVKNDDKGVKVVTSPANYETDPADSTIYTSVEVQPQFPGGMKAFYKYVQDNFKVPNEKLNGNVYVTFVVEKDGTLTDIKVARDLGFGTGQEAERILKNSPQWKPAVQNGRPVRARFSLPIKIVSDRTTPSGATKIADDNSASKSGSTTLPEQPKPDTVYNKPEVTADFPGGVEAFYIVIRDNFKVPENFTGSKYIVATFIVEKDGTLSDIKVIQDIGGDSATQIREILQKSAKWVPASNKGTAVRSRYSLPIKIEGK